MKNKNFKVGDIIISKNNNYVFTRKNNRWIGKVTSLDDEGLISAKTIYCKYLLKRFRGEEFSYLNPNDFIRIYKNKEINDENYILI